SGIGSSVNVTGSDGDNIIIGSNGNDSIDGGTGNDAMSGGVGNDTYTVDSAGDVVSEALNAGTDKVFSSIDYTLTANEENVVLTGTAALNATGDDGNNVLTGNSAANVLNGGDGTDTLTGNAGNDTLDGGAGDDTLDGGIGNDVILIGDAADHGGVEVITG